MARQEQSVFNNPGFYNNSRYFLDKKKACHIGFYGMTRSGKTVNIMGWTEQAFKYCGHKIFYIWDGQRGENCFFLLPSKFRKWIEGITDKHGKVYKSEPSQCILAYPMNKKLPDEIPEPGKVFTIAITSLEIEDIRAIVGTDISKSEEQVWNAIKTNYIDKNTTAPELLRRISNISKEENFSMQMDEGYDSPEVTARGIRTIHDAIERLDKEKIITSETCETCINIWKEYKKPEIFSLVLNKVEPWLAKWLVQWFVRNIFNVLKDRRHKRATAIVLDEAWQIIPKNTITPQQIIIKDAVNQVLVQGLGSANLYFIIGTQIPTQIDVAGGQMRICVVHQTMGVDDIAYFMITESKAWFTSEDRKAIPHLKTGNCFIFTDKGRFYVHAIPPRCRIKHEDDDFIDIWKKEARFLGWKEPMKPSDLFKKPVLEDYDKGMKKNFEEIAKIRQHKIDKENLRRLREQEAERLRIEKEQEEEKRKEERRLKMIEEREKIKSRLEEEKQIKKEKRLAERAEKQKLKEEKKNKKEVKEEVPKELSEEEPPIQEYEETNVDKEELDKAIKEISKKEEKPKKIEPPNFFSKFREKLKEKKWT